MKQELVRALGPAKSRIRLGRTARGAAAGAAAGAACALALLAVTLFLPLEGRWAYAGAALAAGILAGALGNALRPVKNLEAARAADACGLQERAVTALETAEKGLERTEIREAQHRDACEHLRALDARKIPLRFSPKPLYAAAALLLLCAGTLLIPGRGDRIVGERRELAEKIAPMAARIDEAAAEEEKELSEAEKQELRKLTADLKRELDSSRDAVDALVALDKAESRLEEIRKKTAGDAMQELADAMRRAGMDGAAEAMESGNAQSLAEALSEMENGALEKAAEGTSAQAQELAEALERAAAEGTLSQAQLQAMAAMAGNNGSQGNSAMQQALSGMKASLGAQQGQNGSGSQAGSGGSGQKGAGSGAGSGTTNEEQKGGGNGQPRQTSAKGDRPPEYKEGAYEMIYDPEKAEAAFRDVTTEQNKQGEDSVQIETGPGKGRLEGDVPFREVVGEYSREAAEAAESERLTREQKQWVDDYFRRLTED